MNLKQIKGVISEQLVITDLLKKGFFVFTPLHRQCPVDIIAVSPNGKLHLFDVKTQSIRKSGIHKGHFIRRFLSPLQKKLKVNLVYVTEEEIIYGSLKSAIL